MPKSLTIQECRLYYMLQLSGWKAYRPRSKGRWLNPLLQQRLFMPRLSHTCICIYTLLTSIKDRKNHCKKVASGDTWRVKIGLNPGHGMQVTTGVWDAGNQPLMFICCLCSPLPLFHGLAPMQPNLVLFPQPIKQVATLWLVRWRVPLLRRTRMRSDYCISMLWTVQGIPT